MSGYIGKRERKRRQETDTRHLIGVQALTEYGLVTYGQETLVYFLIKPANLSVLSEASIGRRIYALMTVLKGVAEVEMLYIMLIIMIIMKFTDLILLNVRINILIELIILNC